MNNEDQTPTPSMDLNLNRRRFLEVASGTATLATMAGAAIPRDAFAGSHDAPNPAAPLKDLRGKVAFITGGSSGIGLGIARACKEAGMKVCVSYRTQSHMDEAKEFFADDPDNFHYVRLDVTDRDGMKKAADEVEQRFGKVHLLVLNAGVGVGASASSATYNDWDFAIGVNLYGVVNGVHEFLPRMVAHGEPAQIVTTSSMSGVFHGANATVYTTTKYAVVGMMEGLRGELADKNIGVSAFVPGGVNTNIRNSERNRPEELRNEGVPDAAPQAARGPAPARPAGPPPGMDPLECGRLVLRGVKRNDMWIITHPEYGQGVKERCEALVLSIPVGDPPAPPERVAFEARVLTHKVYTDELARLKGA
ncbi:MAG: SDR family NAD(P)-dependent oxidoreductase [Gammaproteobacteria bacterium]|nr:SDR family NAD(P)-dependent oxidoreductase [Gammaproteobacteria bacterium]